MHFFINGRGVASAIYKNKQTKNYPDTPPTIREAVRWIAQLGGFLARKGDGEPGGL